MDSTASYDISSSAAEFLEKEKLCKELCQNINEGVIQPGSISISTPRDLTRTPDEEISDLLKQMNQFLSPRERDVIRSSEEKSVENLLKEAEELIRSSTPLFLNMTFDSSEKSLKSPAKNDNNTTTNNNVSNVTTPKKTKSATPLVEEDTITVVHQTEDTDEVANKNTEDDRNNNKSDTSNSDRITKQNNNKHLKKDVEKENNNKNLKKDVEVNGNSKNESGGLSKTNNSYNNENNQLSTTTTTNNSQQSVSSNPLLEYNNQLFKEIGDKRKKRQSPMVTSPFKKSTKEIQNIEKLTLSDLATPVASGHSVVRMESNKRGSPAKSKEITPGTCCEEQRKKNIELEKIQKNYEEKIFDLEQQINILNAKLKDYEYEALKVNANVNESSKNQHQIELLETELRTQEQLIAGYQRENHKLCQEISACKDQWRNSEMQLLEEKQQLHNELQGMMAASTSEAIKEQLKDVQETVVKLQLELATSKSNNKELELNCERLRGDVTRLEAEVENYCSQIIEFSKKDNDNKSPSPGAALTATAVLSAQLSDTRNAISRKDAEIVRLNTALGTIRAELNKKQLTNSSIQSQQMETLNITVNQLQTALSLERDHVKELTREKDALVRETLDLKRQVRELELIVKRRLQQHSDSQIPFTRPVSSSDSRVRELERELSARQDALSALHAQLQNMQKKYEDHINDLETRLKSSQEDNHKLKATVIKLEETVAAAAAAASVVKTKKVPPPSVTVAAKEDAHLLATIRGLKQEVTTKDKELSRVNKELDDAKKTNRRLQKEREKQLNTLPQNRPSSARGSSAVKEPEKIPTISESIEISPHSSTKTYNPLLFAEIQETVTALRTENKDLKEEVKRLEEDLITMHGKRVHDLNALQNEHDLEVARLLNEHASRHAQSGVAELQGQLYTQQVVITHLKQQLKQVEEFKKEIGLLRAERDHLEQNLLAVKKKLSSVQTLQSPESCQYESVLAKLETLEQSHEIREQKLQSIVRDLLARNTQGGHCSSACRDKLLDKNRQICYYRAEMDRILEVLRGFEFRRSK